MTKRIGIFIFILTVSLIGLSQNKSNNIVLNFELAGNGAYFSLNGEYQIKKIKNNKLNARVGIGCLPDFDPDYLAIPLGINFITGKGKHHLEFGIGTTYLKGIKDENILAPYYENAIDGKGLPYEAIYFVPSMGYRFDKLLGGLIFKVVYSPYFVVHDFFDKEEFFNKYKPIPREDMTIDEFKEYTLRTGNLISIAENKPFYMGISIGYRFK